jgi:hypothetical protein
MFLDPILKYIVTEMYLYLLVCEVYRYDFKSSLWWFTHLLSQANESMVLLNLTETVVLKVDGNEKLGGSGRGQ